MFLCVESEKYSAIKKSFFQIDISTFIVQVMTLYTISKLFYHFKSRQILEYALIKYNCCPCFCSGVVSSVDVICDHNGAKCPHDTI